MTGLSNPTDLTDAYATYAQQADAAAVIREERARIAAQDQITAQQSGLSGRAQDVQSEAARPASWKLPPVGGDTAAGEVKLNPQTAPRVPQGAARPLGPGEFVRNPDGSWSNEISATVTDPGLNGGKPTVVPTLWLVGDKPIRVSPTQAVWLARNSGLNFKSFNTPMEAEQFASDREANWQNIEPEKSGSVPPLWQQTTVATKQTPETLVKMSPSTFMRDVKMGEPTAVGRDIVSGIVQSPKMIATGILKGSAEMFRAGDSLANWLEKNLGTLGLGDIGPESASHPGQVIANYLEQASSGGLPKPRSVTAGVVQSIAQFAVGAKVAGDVLGVGGTLGETATTTAKVAKGAKDVAATAIGGGVAFDPYEGNLANLIERVPSLKNPVTEALAVDPEDSEGVARVKNGIVTALTVLGVKGAQKLAEGVWRGVRMIRSARAAGQEPAEAMSLVEQQKAQYGAISGEMVGETSGPAVVTRDIVDVSGGDSQVKGLQSASLEKARIAEKSAKATEATTTGVPTDVVAKGLTRADDIGGKEFYINFRVIKQPADVQKVYGQFVDAYAAEMKDAQRGVRTWEMTKKAADAIGMDTNTLMARRSGQAFNAEEVQAARTIWAASAQYVTDMARKAAEPNAGVVDEYLLRDAMAKFYAFQAETLGARAESARALNAWAIPIGGGDIERARAIGMLLDQNGGREITRAMAQRLAILADAKAPADAIAAFARRGWGATSWDIVQESFVNGLLWHPATHFANNTSNITVAVQSIYERAVAAKISEALGQNPGEGVAAGEWMAQTYGLTRGIRDALKISGRAFLTGEVEQAPGKIDLARPGALTAQRMAVEAGMTDPAAIQAFKETGLGQAVDFLGFAMRAPGRALGAEDAFFKAIGYRMEVWAQSLRQATGEGLEGPALYQRMAELANNPPESIRIAAADAALYQTFTNAPGKWAQWALQGRKDVPPTLLALPFVRTPANIFRYNFERSPLAPLVGQWRADYAAGGARQSLALARVATGSAILATFADMAYDGYVTGVGPANQTEKEALLRQGWQPYSIYIDGKWIQYNRGTSLGLMMGAVATLGELTRRADFAPEDYDELSEIVAAGGYAIAKSVVDQTFMQGASQIATAIDDQNKLPSYLNQIIGSLVPFSSASDVANKIIDPSAKEVMGPWSAVEQKIAGLAQRLTPKRDLWGQVIQPPAVWGKAYDVVAPFKVSKPIDSPIDAELTRLGAGVARIQKKTSFAGVDINFRDFPQAYDEYVRLAGNELKDPGHNNMGAKDFLDSVVSGKSDYSELYQKLYSDGPEGMKVQFIKQTIHQYRQMAAQKIMADPKFSELAQLVKQKQAEAQQQKMPPGMQLPAMQ